MCRLRQNEGSAFNVHCCSALRKDTVQAALHKHRMKQPANRPHNQGFCGISEQFHQFVHKSWIFVDELLFASTIIHKLWIPALFVQPNHPALSLIKRNRADVLNHGRKTGTFADVFSETAAISAFFRRNNEIFAIWPQICPFLGRNEPVGREFDVQLYFANFA